MKSRVYVNVLSLNEGRHYLGDGLGIHVQKNGKRRWFHRYTSPLTHRVTETGLGSWPVIALREARVMAFKNQQLIKMGVDPVHEKRVHRGLVKRKRRARIRARISRLSRKNEKELWLVYWDDLVKG